MQSQQEEDEHHAIVPKANFMCATMFTSMDDFRAALRIWCNDGHALGEDEVHHRMRLLNCLWSFSGTVHNELRDLRNDMHALHAQLVYLARHQRVQLPMPPPPP